MVPVTIERCTIPGVTVLIVSIAATMVCVHFETGSTNMNTAYY